MKKILTLVLCLFLFTVLSAFTVKTYRTFMTPVKLLEPQPLQELRVEMPVMKIKLDIEFNYFLYRIIATSFKKLIDSISQPLS